MQKNSALLTSRHIDSDGVFSGYAAYFNNLDSHSDVIRPGAFRVTLANWRSRGRWPAMKLMHGLLAQPFTNDDLPIGKFSEIYEDSNGLFVRGRLLALSTDFGRRLHDLMAAGEVLDGLSIGYLVKRSTPGRGLVKRYLDEVELREISLVDVPSNNLSRVSSIKAPSASDEAFEKLRAALQLAPAQASGPSNVDAAHAKLKAALAGLEAA